MSDRYADHDAAWHRDMETEAAAQEPREDVEALHEAIGPPHGDRAKAAAHIELDALLARLEQTERERDALHGSWKECAAHRERIQAELQAAERALREIAEAWPHEARAIARAALASSEGEKKRVLVNTRTGERREWEPGLVLQAEGPLEWELREE